MPCYTVRTVRLRLKADTVDMNLLKEVVTAAGHRVYNMTSTQLTWDTGNYSKATEQITERSEAVGNEIRESYAAKLVEKNLTRLGWQIRSNTRVKARG